MARIVRHPDEDLKEKLEELKFGQACLDAETGYEITRTFGGYIYKCDYLGMVFVPEVEATGTIKNSVAKTEPKKTVIK